MPENQWTLQEPTVLAMTRDEQWGGGTSEHPASVPHAHVREGIEEERKTPGIGHAKNVGQLIEFLVHQYGLASSHLCV